MATGAGAGSSFRFNGTGVKWIAYRDEWSGIARVYVDGTLTGTIDTYASPAAAQAVMYSVSGLASASHTLVIEVTGTKSASSGGAWVWVDAFDVISDGGTTTTPTTATMPTTTTTATPPTPTGAAYRIEESNGAVNWSGPWS